MSINKFIAGLSAEKSDRIAKLLIPFQILSSTIDFFYPKKDTCILCGSNNGEYFSGSPKAFYEYVQDHCPEYTIYHYHPFQKNKSRWEIFKYIITFFPIFYGARYLISSQPPNDFFPFVSWSKKKVFVNTWHGFGMKGVFFADSGDTESNLKRILKLNEKTTYFLVSSKLESAIKAKSFMIDPRKFLYIGQPRNDCFMKSDAGTYLDKLYKDLPEFKKIILYGPTYRRGKPVKFFPFEGFDIQKFNQFLEEEKIIFLLRGHYYERGSNADIFGTRILNLNHDVLEDVEDILPEIDILITDYSALYTTFLLLNRPLIFVPYDLAEIETARGMQFDDYDYWTAGRKVYTCSEFIGAIKEILSGQDDFKTKREDLRKIFHYYQDGNASEKLISVFNELSGRKK